MIEEWNWTRGCQWFPSLRALHPWLRPFLQLMLTWLIHSFISRGLTKWLIEPVGHRKKQKPSCREETHPKRWGGSCLNECLLFDPVENWLVFLRVDAEERRRPLLTLTGLINSSLDSPSSIGEGNKNSGSPYKQSPFFAERKEWFSVVRKSCIPYGLIQERKDATHVTCCFLQAVQKDITLALLP